MSPLTVEEHHLIYRYDYKILRLVKSVKYNLDDLNLCNLFIVSQLKQGVDI